MASEFINFYLKDKQEELKEKWKIVSFLEEELEETEKRESKKLFDKNKNFYSISRLKKILKKKYVS